MEGFYTRNMYRRVRDCWNRPITHCPGGYVEIIERTTPDQGWTFDFTGRILSLLNLGSYNYLGYAQNSGAISEGAKEAIRNYGIGVGSSRQEVGSMELHRELEEIVANFLQVEDAAVFPMGFATNALNLPSLMSEGSLILSDSLNHCSLAVGARLSKAVVRTFRHGGKTFSF